VQGEGAPWRARRSLSAVCLPARVSPAPAAPNALGRKPFLPHWLPCQDVKVSITLSKKSVDFFKSEAAKADIQYQRMIRRLLDGYARLRTRRQAVRNPPNRKTAVWFEVDASVSATSGCPFIFALRREGSY
jgi:hypothetical protein